MDIHQNKAIDFNCFQSFTMENLIKTSDSDYLDLIYFLKLYLIHTTEKSGVSQTMAAFVLSQLYYKALPLPPLPRKN